MEGYSPGFVPPSIPQHWYDSLLAQFNYVSGGLALWNVETFGGGPVVDRSSAAYQQGERSMAVAYTLATLGAGVYEQGLQGAVGATNVATGVGAPAQNIANAPRLAQQLRAEQLSSQFTAAGTLTPEAIANSQLIMQSSRLGNPAIPAGFAKYTTAPLPLPSGAGSATTRFYMNPGTREVFYGLDYKTLFLP
jgi:hypothetical protein